MEYFPLEVGARGIINKANKETIKDISIYTNTNAKKLIKALSKQAVTSSYFIFLNRNERDWSNDLTWKLTKYTVQNDLTLSHLNYKYCDLKFVIIQL